MHEKIGQGAGVDEAALHGVLPGAEERIEEGLGCEGTDLICLSALYYVLLRQQLGEQGATRQFAVLWMLFLSGCRFNLGLGEGDGLDGWMGGGK